MTITKSLFVSLPPVVVTIQGRDYFLSATVAPGGLCSYKSKPIELFVPSPTGLIRVNGTFILTPWRSRHWQMK